MSFSTNANDQPKSVRRLVHWWRDWIGRRRTMADLACCGPAEVERVARDLALAKADLQILAGKWPTSVNLLSRRMTELGLDQPGRVEGGVMRDLRRTCSLCSSKRRCRHDLVRNPSDSVWKGYCPNATTLSALVAERSDARRGEKAT